MTSIVNFGSSARSRLIALERALAARDAANSGSGLGDRLRDARLRAAAEGRGREPMDPDEALARGRAMRAALAAGRSRGLR